MEFERTDPVCKFVLPDVITVRAQMSYFSAYPQVNNPQFFMRSWEAAKKLITAWECPIFPDIEGDLDKVSDPQITLVLIWAATQVTDHINSLKSVPKV